MSNCKNYSKGLTLVEVLTASVLLTLITVASYSAFISTLQFGAFSRDELESSQEAANWIERVRMGATTGTRYQNIAATTGWVDLNATTSILQENYSLWSLAQKSNVSNLKVEYDVSDNIDLGCGVADYNFRRIRIKVTWDEL